MAKPHYTTLKAGCFRGTAYVLLLTGGNGELVCRIGTDVYGWQLRNCPEYNQPQRMRLVRKRDGYVFPDVTFTEHVDKVADRNLNRIGS